jgi:hypothetical protein
LKTGHFAIKRRTGVPTVPWTVLCRAEPQCKGRTAWQLRLH